MPKDRLPPLEEINHKVANISTRIDTIFWSGNDRVISDLMQGLQTQPCFLELKHPLTIKTLSDFYIGTEDALEGHTVLMSDLRETIKTLVSKGADPRGVTQAAAALDLAQLRPQRRDRLADLLGLSAKNAAPLLSRDSNIGFFAKAESLARSMIENTPVVLPTGDKFGTTKNLFNTIKIAAQKLFWEAPANGFDLNRSWLAIATDFEKRGALVGADAFVALTMTTAKDFYALATNSPEPAETTKDSIFGLAAKYFEICVADPLGPQKDSTSPMRKSFWSPETQDIVLDVLNTCLESDHPIATETHQDLKAKAATLLTAPALPDKIQSKVMKIWLGL